MVTALVLSFFTLWASPRLVAGEGGQAAAPPKAVTPSAANLASDPYAPLRLYDGKWEALPASGDKTAETVHIENRCAKVGEFFACNQFVNGKNMALVVFLPTHPTENGGYAYRNQVLRPEGEDPSSWGSLEIVGDRWVYSSDAIVDGKKVYWRTTNIFSGPDKIHFDVERSGDGVKWTSNLSGDEVRAK